MSQTTGYKAIVHITSPVQDQIYRTNNILVNFTCDTNIPESEIYSFMFAGNIDGQVGYHGGDRLWLGTFQKPLSSFYSIPVNVSEGTHLLWVQVSIGISEMDSGVAYPSGVIVEDLSQIVSFTVDTGAGTPNPAVTPTPQPTNSAASNTEPTATPTVPESSWVAIAALLVSVLCVEIIFRHRKH
ncbi:MAG: hypothetical protein NWE92_08325 [Candidatus Bathyarchaeota archaeon]|nr:hypothetical protein [Candidatus Bathyarchaeota archaeon]